MIRVLRNVALMALLGCPALASAAVRPGIDFGPSFVWADWDEKFPAWSATGERLDVSGGITGEASLGGRWALVSGLRYSGLGTHVEYNTFSSTGEASVHQHYLVVPLWLRLDLPGTAGLFLQAGPEVGYLIAAEARMEDGEFGASEQDVLGDMKRSNLCASGALGVRRSVGPRSFELVLRYSRGLTDTARPEEWYSTWRTREFHVGLGLR